MTAHEHGMADNLCPAFRLAIEYAGYQTGIKVLAKEGGWWALSL